MRGALVHPGPCHPLAMVNSLTSVIFIFRGRGERVRGWVLLDSVTVPWPAARGSVPSPHSHRCLWSLVRWGVS